MPLGGSQLQSDTLPAELSGGIRCELAAPLHTARAASFLQPAMLRILTLGPTLVLRYPRRLGELACTRVALLGRSHREGKSLHQPPRPCPRRNSLASLSQAVAGQRSTGVALTSDVALGRAKETPRI